MLILPAAPAAAISGQQDKSIVYFRWRGNQAARSYAIPANPKTTNQQAVRAALATLSSSWAGLSDSERATWDSYGTTNKTRDRMGREVTPTGLNWYIKANSNRLYQALAAVDTAPVANAPAPVPLTGATATEPNGIELTITAPGTTGLQIKCQVEILPTAAWTPSQARSRFVAGIAAGSYIAVPTTPGTGTVTFSSDITFAAGQSIAIWATTVRTADGTESLPQLITVIATS